MDLEYHEGNAFSKILWDYYKEMAGEAEVNSLLTFYEIYRAFVRWQGNTVSELKL